MLMNFLARMRLVKGTAHSAVRCALPYGLSGGPLEADRRHGSQLIVRDRYFRNRETDSSQYSASGGSLNQSGQPSTK